MASGGARSRSGPRPSPLSKRSDRRGIQGEVTYLPAQGWDGKPPPWPLPKKPSRETALWRKAWKFPQAAAWSKMPWLHLMIAQWVHWTVKSEQPDASPSTMTQVIRLADAIGLTPAGMREHGWVVREELDSEEAEPNALAPVTPMRRLRE